jgi:hypothetical protein
MGRVEGSIKRMRVYWRVEDDGFIRCDEFSLDDVLKLIELTKSCDYVKVAGKDDDDPCEFCYTELVLGNPDTHQVDHVNIWVDYSDF